MVAFARESEVNNGAHSVNPLSRKRRGNAERWIEANSICRVETHGLADFVCGQNEPAPGFVSQDTDNTLRIR